MLAFMSLQDYVELALWAIARGRYCDVVGFTLSYYDWLLTLDDEVKLIHGAKWTSIKVAYLLSRYYPLFAWPALLWAWMGSYPVEYCTKFTHELYALIVPFQNIARAVIVVRTYAFTGMKRSVLFVLLTVFLSVLAADIWLYGTQYGFPPILDILVGDTGCFANDMHAEAALFEKSSAPRAGLVVLSGVFLDVLCIGLMVVHCLRMNTTGQLGRYFLAQGIGYFLVVAGGNLVLACIYLNANWRVYDGVSLPISCVLSDIMASRLILQVRKKIATTECEVSGDHSTFVASPASASTSIAQPTHIPTHIPNHNNAWA